VQRRELEYLSHRLDTAEVNGSFYSLQRPERYRAWFDETPQDFLFAVKGGRFLTHMKRLRDVDTPLANFFASGVLALGHKLGPILWQLPPNMEFDADRLVAFFALLPKTTKEAAALAKEHDSKLKGEAYTKPGPNRPLRYALEVRHPSFRTREFLGLMRENAIASVISDSAGTWLTLEEVTSDFVYVRLHGDEELYTSGYTDKALANWAKKIRRWQQGGRDAYVYFDNDAEVKAPFDALSLAERCRKVVR
jgi:uncharacterized protein YecE (DUF72 family)